MKVNAEPGRVQRAKSKPGIVPVGRQGPDNGADLYEEREDDCYKEDATEHGSRVMRV